MLKVGITGQRGFVGGHLANWLALQSEMEVVACPIGAFDDQKLLAAFVRSTDVIVHLAALNRHNDLDYLYTQNIALMQRLLDACEAEGVAPAILFSSSTQESLDNPYGRSKKRCGELLAAWAKQKHARHVEMIIPNVFGAFGKPFYNSVVATFCYQLTHGEMPTVMQDKTISLTYVNELVQDITALITSEQDGRVEMPARHEASVTGILDKLKSYKETYLEKGQIPELNDKFDTALFNTYRSYIDPTHWPVAFTQHTDSRGAFVEVLRTQAAGQFSFSTTLPGITRGNHFHTRKVERFAVIQGKARISLRRIGTDEVHDYDLDGQQPAFVDMPIWVTHNITNIGTNELITLFWINEPYDPADPDTYFVNVTPEPA